MVLIVQHLHLQDNFFRFRKNYIFIYILKNITKIYQNGKNN